MKAFLRLALALYLCMLLWFVLFKTSFDIVKVLSEGSMRAVNLVPFNGHASEMLENVAIFIPLGLLVSVNFKGIVIWKKLIAIFALSIIIETTQYILSIGVSDITDVLTNTIGGLFGLLLYAFINRSSDSQKKDIIISVASIVLIALFLILRLFVFRVKYA